MGIYRDLWGFWRKKWASNAHEYPCFPERTSEMPIFSGMKITHIFDFGDEQWPVHVGRKTLRPGFPDYGCGGFEEHLFE